jgi:hypothetical protein
MSINYYANRVQETSITTTTANPGGNLVLNGASVGYRTLVGTIGPNNNFSYYIYRTDASANFEWEIGIGYISSTGGINQLVREKVIASSNAGAFVGFTTGTKFIEPIISEDRVNSSFLNLVERSTSFTAPIASATYVVDASSNNVTVTLPSVSGIEPVVLGFMLNKTIGDQFEQSGAVTLVPSGLETINGANTSYGLSIKRDFIQLVSVPSQSGWLVLDPIQDSTVAYGNLGTIQFANNQAFSGVPEFSWEPSSSSLLVGGTGTITSADIILPVSSQTVVFNEQSLDKDFRIEGSGNTHLLFVDASTNNVGINTSNPTDKLTIESTSGSGLTIETSGLGPYILLKNTSVSGVSSNNNLAGVSFQGYNSVGSTVPYAEIYAKILSNVDGSEDSSVNIDVNSDGAKETVASFSSSGITLGFNSQNIDGVLIGSVSSNEGDNVALGYYNNVCGSNCVVLGNNSVVNSGTFGGVIGLEHSISGSNVWVVGGSGVQATGSNAVYLALDNNTYLKLDDKTKLRYTTQSTNNISIGITNTAILSSGLDESVSLEFTNASGVQKTGLSLTNRIVDVTNGSENTSFVASILQDGSSTQILRAEKDTVLVGANSVSGANVVVGHTNTVSSSGNIVYGQNIATSGSSNILLGKNISITGTNTTVVGSDNLGGPLANLGVIMVGNNNTANEDYVLTVGDNNSASGLYAIACGYNNGSHGEYSVAVGSDNLATTRASVLVGRSNSASGTSLDASVFTVGIGNTAIVSNSGVLVGYDNELYGVGGLVCGNNNYSSGNNNILLTRNSDIRGTNNVVIGNDITYSGNNSVIISGSATQIYGSNISFSGNTISQTAGSSAITVASTGISVTGITSIRASGNSISVHNTGITLVGSGDMTVSVASGTINYQVNANNKINISSSGTEIYGSVANIYSNATNNVFVSSTGISVSGNRIDSRANSTNNIAIASTGLDLYGNKILLQSSDLNNRINIASTGVDVFGSGVVALRANPTGQILNFVSSTNYSSVTSTGNNIYGTRVDIQASGNNRINLLPTGIDIVSSGYVSLTAPNVLVNISASGIAYTGYPTTGGGSQLVIEDNIIKASTSSQRYKENIRPYDKGLEDVLKLEPMYFNFKGNSTVRAGLIAEQVASSGLEEFVVRDSNGTIESVNYHHMVVLLVNSIKELQKEIDSLKNQSK